MSESQKDIGPTSFNPLITEVGSQCRTYPQESGKVCGPLLAGSNTHGTVTTMLVTASGVGSGIGSYQLQSSDDNMRDIWFNTGSVITSQSVTSFTANSDYVRVIQVGVPDDGVTTRVCLHVSIEED